MNEGHKAGAGRGKVLVKGIGTEAGLNIVSALKVYCTNMSTSSTVLETKWYLKILDIATVNQKWMNVEN